MTPCIGVEDFISNNLLQLLLRNYNLFNIQIFVDKENRMTNLIVYHYSYIIIFYKYLVPSLPKYLIIKAFVKFKITVHPQNGPDNMLNILNHTTHEATGFTPSAIF